MAHSEHTHSVAAACWMRARVLLCTNIIWLSFLGSGIQRETPSGDGQSGRLGCHFIAPFLLVQRGKKQNKNPEDFLLRCCVFQRFGTEGSRSVVVSSAEGFYMPFFVPSQTPSVALQRRKKKKTMVCCNTMNSTQPCVWTHFMHYYSVKYV